MERVHLTLAGQDDFFTNEAYKTLRTNLQFCGKDIRVIGVTSCSENEGKTTIVLNTAKSFSELGKRVLIVDADMRKSVIAGRNTDVADVVGLSEVLTGLSQLGDSLYATQYPGLNILFSGKFPPNPVELLGGKYFGSAIEALKKVYDYIFIDTPPLGQVIDASIVATQCDGMMLVIGNSKLHIKQVQDTVEQLRKSGCPILGAVRNHAGSGNGYYHSGYYKKYGKYGK